MLGVKFCGSFLILQRTVATQLRRWDGNLLSTRPQRQVSTNPQTKPTKLACVSAGMLLPLTISIYYYCSAPKADDHFTVQWREEAEFT